MESITCDDDEAYSCSNANKDILCQFQWYKCECKDFTFKKWEVCLQREREKGICGYAANEEDILETERYYRINNADADYVKDTEILQHKYSKKNREI